jgi:hypothetical protein
MSASNVIHFVIASVFLENDIDLVMFQTLTEKDLLTIGIFSLGAGRLMLNALLNAQDFLCKNSYLSNFSGKFLLR